MIETFTLEDISPGRRLLINKARDVGLSAAFPPDKNTKVGCILETPEGVFTGTNIKRWSWNNNTCAERMAIDRALFSGITALGRLTVWSIDQANPSEKVTSPCGPCREIIKETLVCFGQDDVEIVMSNAAMSKIIVANLTDLLPL